MASDSFRPTLHWRFCTTLCRNRPILGATDPLPLYRTRTRSKKADSVFCTTASSQIKRNTSAVARRYPTVFREIRALATEGHVALPAKPNGLLPTVNGHMDASLSVPARWSWGAGLPQLRWAARAYRAWLGAWASLRFRSNAMLPPNSLVVLSALGWKTYSPIWTLQSQLVSVRRRPRTRASVTG